MWLFLTFQMVLDLTDQIPIVKQVISQVLNLILHTILPHQPKIMGRVRLSECVLY